jgi:primosomal protein N' (replication factor Y)
LARANRSAPPACRLCNRAADDWRCPHCGEHRLRAAVVGARRTVEELGRAFPHVIVRSSTADTMLAAVSAEPVLVVATPGAEPTADGGYGATLLLDGWLELTRPDLRAAEQALRRWMAAAALTRSGADGGVVVIMAGGAHPAVQALLRWQPAPFAAREAADRAALGFPPATRLAAIDGPLEAVHALVAASPVPATVEELGPVPLADSGESRLLLRVPRHDGAALAAALQSGMVARGLARTVPVRVILDPRDVA